MQKIFLKLVLVGVGILCIFFALFADILRGRPFFLGPMQILVLTLGILLIVFDRIITSNMTIIQSFYLSIFNKGQELTKSLSNSIDFLNRGVSSTTERIINFLHQRSIYSSTIWKTLNAIAFLILFSFLFRYALLQLSNPTTDPWITGDWLINYQGGFVRRGLPGEIILWFSRTLDIQVTVLVVAIQMLMYLVFYISTYRLVLRSSFSALNVALIFSPAFMLFTAFDPYGGFRKEVLFLAFFSWLINYLSSKEKSESRVLPVLIGIFTTAIVLSHEMLVAFLPYIVGAFFICDGGFSKRTWGIIASLLPAFLIGTLVIFCGRGNDQIVMDICHSLSSSAPKNCIQGGAIGALSDTVNSAHEVVRYYNDFETRIAYMLTAFLGFVPLLLHYFSKPLKVFLNDNRIKIWLLSGILITITVSLPLFWVVADYGRVIYIHIASLSLLVLLINSKMKSAIPKVDLRWLSGWALSLLYILSWRLIHHNASFITVFPILKYINSLFG